MEYVDRLLPHSEHSVGNEISKKMRKKNSEYLLTRLAEPVTQEQRKKAKRCGTSEHVTHGGNN